MRTFIPRISWAIVLLIALTQTSVFAHFGTKGPYGGSISCITVYDTTVYLGTFEGGLFESTNSKLTTWRARPVGLKSGKITAIAHTGKFLFAGTADSGLFIFNGFVGTDRYWNKINQGLTNLKITALIAIDETTLMAGTNGGGLFITTNSGTSWSAVNNDLPHLTITGLVKAGNRIFSISNGGVYYTENNGTSWTEFNDSNTKDVNATAISYNAVSDKLLVANGNGLYIAANASSSATAVFASVTTGLPSGIAVRSLSNNGTDWFLASDKGAYTTAASSINWTTMNTGLTTEDVTAVAPFKNNIVCGAKVKGFFKSANPFISWSVMNNGLNNLRTYSMITGGENLVIAATELGVFVSKDLAASYVSANKGLGDDSVNVTDLAVASFGLYASTKNSGIFFSPDSGKTWTAINTGLTNLSIDKIFIINGDKYAFCSTGIIYFSASNTTAWSSLQTGLPSGVKLTSLTSVGTKLLLSTYGDGVFVREATANAWTAINSGLSNMNVTSVTALGSKIFAGTDGSGVFVSDAVNVNWHATAPTAIEFTDMFELYGSKIQAMGTLNSADRKYVFASYKGGLLATSDYGETWEEGGNQFNLPTFTDVNKISFVTSRVFVTTDDNGLYSNAISELEVTTGIFGPIVANNKLPLSPNPTKGDFKIDLSAITTKVDAISIYNNRGVLMDQFDGTSELLHVNYPSGFYMVQIRTSENEVYSQKLIIQ